MTTMTIKSFKEQSQVNELAPLALVPAAVGMAVRAAPTIARSAVANADKVGAAATVAHNAVKKGVSKVKKFMKKEEVQLDEKMPPEAHVARSKKNPDMFCVFDKDGKEHKLFKDKKDAEEYAVKNHDKLMGEGYSSFAQQKAVWANRKDGGKGHPDNKKKSKKEGVDEISRDDMVKKVSSTIGSKAPMMINPQNKEKNKIKTGLDRLRKALGPNHVMNQSATSEGLFFGKRGPAVISRLARGVASRVTTKGKLDRAKKKQGKLDNKINLAKTRTDIANKKAELKKLRRA